ncbi:MAG: hypothetical protein WKG00_02145 [Polyangiaceae bacterium]
MASCPGSAPRTRTRSERSLPSRYSMTMYGTPFSSAPTSSTRATCSLWIFTAVRASREKRATTSGFLASSACTNFSATLWSRCTWVAATTTPMPPSPRTRSTRYLPARMEPGAGAFTPAPRWTRGARAL